MCQRDEKAQRARGMITSGEMPTKPFTIQFTNSTILSALFSTSTTASAKTLSGNTKGQFKMYEYSERRTAGWRDEVNMKRETAESKKCHKFVCPSTRCKLAHECIASNITAQCV